MLKTAEEEINENNGERFKVINIQKYKNIIKEYDKEIETEEKEARGKK